MEEQQPILERLKKRAASARTETQLRDAAIREALEKGVSGTEIAKATGLSRQRVYQIKLNS